MIVYGKRRKKYVLAQNPVSQDYDGAVYSVPANKDILVKIYQPEYRTPETEKLVIDTANGKCSMLDESPVDVVYANGRFAGYIFETSAPEIPMDPIPEVSVRPREGLSTPIALLICIGSSLIFSALIYFVIFNMLRTAVGDPYGFWNFDGIPMIIGGWVLMGTAFYFFRENGTLAAILGTVAFPVGAAVIFGVIVLLVWLLLMAWSLFKILLPLLAAVGIVIVLVKALLTKWW